MRPSAPGTRVTPDGCARQIMETVPLVMRHVRTEMRRQGDHALSVPQFRALAFVGRNPGVALAGVAEHLGVTPATASAAVERLVRRGLLSREAHPDERRRVVLTLTAAGGRLLDRARASTRRKIADLLAGLSVEQLRRVAAGLEVLGGVFDRVGKEVPRERSGRRR
jgi:DNA-binding MarR family transcriptional regulator